MAWDDSIGRVNRATRRRYGRPVEFTLKEEDSPHAITAEFNRTYREQRLDDGQVVSATEIRLTVVDADLPRAPLKGDTCEVDGTTYTVRDAQPDGSGQTYCLLRG